MLHRQIGLKRGQSRSSALIFRIFKRWNNGNMQIESN